MTIVCGRFSLCYFTMALYSLLGLNAGMSCAASIKVSPLVMLRHGLAARCTRLKVPKPRMVTSSPLATAFLISSVVSSIVTRTTSVETPNFSETALVNYCFVITKNF